MSQASGATFINESFSLPSRRCGRKWKRKKPLTICFLKCILTFLPPSRSSHILASETQHLSPQHLPVSCDFGKSEWGPFILRMRGLVFIFSQGFQDLDSWWPDVAFIISLWAEPKILFQALLKPSGCRQWWALVPHIPLPYMVSEVSISSRHQLPACMAVAWDSHTRFPNPEISTWSFHLSMATSSSVLSP